MPGLDVYLDLERQLLRLRREKGDDSPEEEALLDRMDDAWRTMTHDERAEYDRRKGAT